MIRLSEDDVLPVDTFPMKWRWTDERHHLLPAAVLEQIKPILATRINEIRRKIYFPDQPEKDPLWQVEDVIDAAEDRDHVEQWLRGKITDATEDVIVYWAAPRHAVLTTWDIFCTYWDDFCYPSSDDVIVLPVSEQWEAVYHHEEIFSVLFRR